VRPYVRPCERRAVFFSSASKQELVVRQNARSSGFMVPKALARKSLAVIMIATEVNDTAAFNSASAIFHGIVRREVDSKVIEEVPRSVFLQGREPTSSLIDLFQESFFKITQRRCSIVQLKCLDLIQSKLANRSSETV